LPCPKIPKIPAKKRRSAPSRSTYCWLRKRTIAWAAVIRFVAAVDITLSFRPRD
jgi:hypothetical protein